MDDWEQALGGLPSYMHNGVKGYIEKGYPIGGFLTSLFSNDLKGSYRGADATNLRFMERWVDFLFLMPGPSQGSLEKVHAWQKAGGMQQFNREESTNV
jgi:hypothetical protein